MPLASRTVYRTDQTGVEGGEGRPSSSHAAWRLSVATLPVLLVVSGCGQARPEQEGADSSVDAARAEPSAHDAGAKHDAGAMGAMHDADAMMNAGVVMECDTRGWSPRTRGRRRRERYPPALRRSRCAAQLSGLARELRSIQ